VAAGRSVVFQLAAADTRLAMTGGRRAGPRWTELGDLLRRQTSWATRGWSTQTLSEHAGRSIQQATADRVGIVVLTRLAVRVRFTAALPSPRQREDHALLTDYDFHPTAGTNRRLYRRAQLGSGWGRSAPGRLAHGTR
jgi:hypothetical protein